MIASNELEVLKDLELGTYFFQQIIHNCKYNNDVSKYYLALAEAKRDRRYPIDDALNYKAKSFLNKADYLQSCCSYFTVDHYRTNHIKNVIGTISCKDKFCETCRNSKQLARSRIFTPHFKENSDQLYHLTITVRNVDGVDLESTINKMQKSFRKLIRYFRGNILLKGLDFSKFGYKGCFRSLEVTYKDDSEPLAYHPHYHVAMVFEKDNVKIRRNYNKFSRNYDPKKRKLFSDFEIMIQKMWCLIFNGEKVTLEALQKMDINDGLDCEMHKFCEKDYEELFKYMIKGKKEDNADMTFSNFVFLQNALHKVRQVQGYGCFYRLNDNLITDEVWEQALEEYEETLRLLDEKPVQTKETSKDLLASFKDCSVISVKIIFQELKKQMAEKAKKEGEGIQDGEEL